MADNIRVRLKIESTIENLDSSGLPDGDPEKSVSETEGLYRHSSLGATLAYSEETDGGRITSRIVFDGESLSVRRSGAIESDMLFKEGESFSSAYSMPPFTFDMSVTAKRVRIELDGEGGKIDLIYKMTIGGAEKSARMKIWISPISNQA